MWEWAWAPAPKVKQTRFHVISASPYKRSWGDFIHFGEESEKGMRQSVRRKAGVILIQRRIMTSRATQQSDKAQGVDGPSSRAQGSTISRLLFRLNKEAWDPKALRWME